MFFAAGGAYKSADIERVLRFRCSQLHLDERKPTAHREDRTAPIRRPPPRKSVKRTDRRGPYKPTRHTHWADAEDDWEYDDEEDSFGDPDNEDLEHEALMAEEDMPEEEAYEDDEGYYDDDDEDLDTVDRGALQEAFSAGWSAKSKTAQQRKGRGYKGDGKPKGKGKGKSKRPPDTRTPDARKKNSTCASCGQRGHWKGDEVCPNVRSGKDAVHQKRDNEAHFNTGTHKGQRHPSAGPARPVKSEPPPERDKRAIGQDQSSTTRRRRISGL